MYNFIAQTSYLTEKYYIHVQYTYISIVCDPYGPQVGRCLSPSDPYTLPVKTYFLLLQFFSYERGTLDAADRNVNGPPSPVSRQDSSTQTTPYRQSCSPVSRQNSGTQTSATVDDDVHDISGGLAENTILW
jgi:hypothetical protein